ncbi:50S ribosomal protein L25/general stress protein Ctc, partial [uncultured Desulfovibrio sp.]
MSIEKTLSVQKRENSGKGPSGRLRSQNLIPGVYYTAQGENITVQAPALPLEKIYEEVGHTTVFNLEIEENSQKSTHPVLIWQVQRHPYKNCFTHIDFYGVDLDKEVKVDVPLEFVGVSRGVKLGGVLETYRESVRLSSKPLDMPQKVTIDVSDMNINDTI